jgi:hypothetical protein
MADFSSALAEMVARTRIPQAPPQTRPGVIGGGPIAGTSRQFQANIDVGSIAKLLGWKSPEEKQKIADQYMAFKHTSDPQQYEQLLRAPGTQKIYQDFSKAGVPGVYQRPDGLYDFPEETEEARIARQGMTPEQIYAAGGTPAEKLEAVRTRLAKVEKPSEASLRAAQANLVGQQTITERERANLVKGQMAEARARAGLAGAQAEYYGAATQKAKEMLPYEKAESSARAILNQAQADAAVVKMKQEDLLSKSEEESLKGILSGYRSTRNDWSKMWMGMPSSTSVVQREIAMDKLTAATGFQLDGVGSIGKKKVGDKIIPDTSMGNESLGYWLQIVGSELDNTKKDTSPEAVARWQKHSRELENFLMKMGPGVNSANLQKSLENFVRMYARTQPSDEMEKMANTFVRIGQDSGYTMQYLIDLINMRKLSFAPPGGQGGR